MSSSVVALQQGWHWLGSIHAYSGTHGTTGATGSNAASAQSGNHSVALHASHGTAAHGPAAHDPSQNGSLGQHVNTHA